MEKISGWNVMIHKDIISGKGVNKLILRDLEELIIKDPIGRVNFFTKKPKENGSQHDLILTENLNLFPLYAELIFLSDTYNLKIGGVWANVCHPNAIGVKHNHKPNPAGVPVISGCYYIDVPENSGSIEFETGEVIYPQAGEIYWWGSDKIHWTNKNNSNKNRFSIAFNLDAL
jgi:hypothetical protein